MFFLKTIILITCLSIVCFFVHGSESPLEINFMPEASQIRITKIITKNSKSGFQISQSQSQSESQSETSAAASGNDDSQAKGLILAFKVWPPEKKNKTSLLEKLTKAGLKKKSEFERFKAWVFEWPEWHNAIEAEKLCEELSTLSFVDYCEPDSLLEPATKKIQKL